MRNRIGWTIAVAAGAVTLLFGGLAVSQASKGADDNPGHGKSHHGKGHHKHGEDHAGHHKKGKQKGRCGTGRNSKSGAGKQAGSGGRDDGPNHDIADDHGQGDDDGPNHDIADDHGQGDDDGPDHT